MTEFVEWFNSGVAASWDPVVRAVVAHFYLASIHPFGDGNGRTSRAVESFLLYGAGVNARGFFSLANYFYRNRQEYVGPAEPGAAARLERPDAIRGLFPPRAC